METAIQFKVGDTFKGTLKTYKKTELHWRWVVESVHGHELKIRFSEGGGHLFETSDVVAVWLERGFWERAEPTNPKVQCGCGHHLIETGPDTDPYAQHAAYLGEGEESKLHAIEGIGASRVLYTAQVEDQYEP